MKALKTISVFLILILTTLPILAQTEEEVPLQVKKLSKRAIAITEDSPMENIIVAIASNKGLIVIDSSGSPYTAAKIRKVIEKNFGRKDFAYLINTHHHWDHAWGNQVFSDAEIIGHERCIEPLQRNSENASNMAQRMGQNVEKMNAELKKLDPESEEAQELKKRLSFNTRIYKGLKSGFSAKPPTIGFNDNLTLDLEDITVKLYFFGRAHSGSDIFIHVPEEGLLMTGDLFLERGWLPLFSGLRELDVPRWIEVMNTVLEDESQVKYVIPGHRDVWAREKLVIWRDYIVKLWEGLVAAEEEGLSLEEAEKRFPLDEKFDYLKEYGHTDTALQRFHARNIRAFWGQLQESASYIVEKVIAESGIEAAVAKYRELKSRPSKDYFLDEYSFNALGYRLLQQRKIKEAIEIFRLNVEAYPKSWNVYDSLAEAYMINGDKELAIKNYEKSLKLNPENDNAKEMLKRLKEGK